MHLLTSSEFPTELHLQLHKKYQFGSRTDDQFHTETFSIGFQETESKQGIEIAYFDVATGQRGRGIGTEVIQSLCKIADDLRYNYIQLSAMGPIMPREDIVNFFGQQGFHLLHVGELVKGLDSHNTQLVTIEQTWVHSVATSMRACVARANLHDIERSMKNIPIAERAEIHDRFALHAKLDAFFTSVLKEPKLQKGKMHSSHYFYFLLYLAHFYFHYNTYTEITMDSPLMSSEVIEWVDTELASLYGYK